MPDPHQLAQEAGSLDNRQWRVFLDDLSQVRTQRWQSEASEPPENPNRDQVAEWIAKKHLAVDTGITDVLYLPTNAPEQEIRLIEANTLLAGLPDEDITPIDFGFNVEGLRFMLLVVDVTPDQWQRIVKGDAPLPEGWTFEGNKHFGYPPA